MNAPCGGRARLVRVGRIVATAVVLWLTWPSAILAVEPFVVVAVPDIQNETLHHPEMLQSQITWIVDHRESLNIAFVSQQGDLTHNATEAEYVTAHEALFQLSKVNGLPWGTCAGNHDLLDPSGPAYYDKYFGPANFAGKNWYGNSSHGHSSYQTFLAGGRKYLVLNIEYDAPAAVRQWAQGIIDAHAGMPTIVNTHNYIGYYVHGRSPYGDTLWDGLVKNNSQIFMVICGHSHYAWTQTSLNAAGKPVFELLANYQDMNSGDGYLRLYAFDEAASKIRVKTYSPYNTEKPYLTDAPNQFDLEMNFDARLGKATEASPPSGQVKLRIIYHEKHYLLGPSVRSVDGVKEYVFQNVSEKPMTIVFPPNEVLFLSETRTEMLLWEKKTTWRQRLEEKDWPEFLRKPISFTLAPGEKRVFTSPFCMDIPKSARKEEGGPNLRLLFNRQNGEKGAQVFSGQIVSESVWDDSNTMNAMEAKKGAEREKGEGEKGE